MGNNPGQVIVQEAGMRDGPQRLSVTMSVDGKKQWIGAAYAAREGLLRSVCRSMEVHLPEPAPRGSATAYVSVWCASFRQYRCAS
jgi:hypothetical protein